MKTSIIKNTILLLLFIFSSPELYAQNPISGIKIFGSLSDEKNKPMDYATVSLLRAKDSSIVKGTLSMETGAYIFDHILPGSYIVKATEIGYDDVISHIFGVADSSANFTIPVLKLQTSSKTLGTVTITAAKPVIERKSDRTVLNVENSVLAAGNSALEILARAPGVTIDQNGNISLNGKQGVTVMINDKLTYLSAEQLTTLLRSTDGSTIHSIELLTNPSSKYDAAGSSGIINIQLKTNKKTGTNGSITLGAGYGNYGKDRNTLTLNHEEGRLNVFSTFSHDDNKSQINANLKRIVTDSTGVKTYFNQLSSVIPIDHNNSYRLGADYDLTAQNTIGFIINGYFNNEKDPSNDLTYIGSQPNVTSSYQNTLSEINQTNKNFALNLNDRIKLDTNGQQLNVDLDYSRFNNNSNSQYNTYFYLPDGSSIISPAFLKEQTPSVIDIRTAKADYMLSINNILKLETGVKFSDVKTDNNLEAQQQVNGSYENDATLTNRFIYDEKIDAGYINLSKTYKNTTIQAGLRAEYTNSSGDLINTNQEVIRHYLDLFPNVVINHTLNDQNQISFSYSRRIDRPGYDDLNPFIYYIDQYTYTKGNPFLNPQYTNKFELNYTFDKIINLSLGYSRTNDAITAVLLTDAESNITDQTKVNLQQQNYYDLNANSPYTISKWWTGNISATVFYTGFKSDSLLGGTLNRGQLSYLFNTTQIFDIAKGYKAELISIYESALTYGIYSVRPHYSNDIGMNHSFDNSKANVKFSVSDIFNTNRDRVSSNYQTDNININQKLESRIIRLTFTYNFGSNKLKTIQHESGADDLKERVKGSN
ncbi:TonB-dependent receptor domain-containing protein [Mucilaginibacter sp. E4BP6]|uniref:outer membrane beta-barrel family protein n=1 Tax=Mucilaginibacter sp. E4BP6 TaxID=2723089 RepID=UPI0015CDF8BD|nr:outer membrane beta-barrel family protein [Mucilaginibacter sp. E4BP6]NYE64952.1 hypothetical protein [Mucilaginibacter sp. E4BP6]